MKKIFLFLSVFMTAMVSKANSFDQFVGEYSIVGAPLAQKSGSARGCIRFGFDKMIGLSVIADTEGYKQSHMLHFNVSTGWFGHPIMDFNDLTSNSGSYAKTTGGTDFAQNEWTSVSGDNSTPLFVSIQKDGNQYILKMTESYIEKGNNVGSCYYQATLIKK
ncbi:MAG: hypothetical protein J7501_06865 [Bdellovibrio sp.]|nr:hypothetical protein [Bdellovibrio sp.]